jgi:hypothetical protein
MCTECAHVTMRVDTLGRAAREWKERKRKAEEDRSPGLGASEALVGKRA